jgi:ABC-type branched-subunit amino acid transport system ATPase component
MAEAFDPGALMARYYTLRNDLRVCLRLARTSDRNGVAELCRRHGLDPTQLELARMLAPAPRERLVLVATALIGSRETVLGVGAIDLEPDADPSLLLLDERAEGLGPLLADALLGRTEALLRARAA